MVPHGEWISEQMPILGKLPLDEAQLAEVMQDLPGGAENVQAIYPLSPLQEGMLFHCLMHERTDVYVFSTLLELDSREDLDRWIDALNKVISRHEIMRISMVWQKVPQPIQVLHRHVTLPVDEVVLDGERDPVEQLKEQMLPGRQQSIDVRRAPLAQLLTASNPKKTGKCYALLLLHHLVSDLRSLKVLITEARACLGGREHELAPPEDYRQHLSETIGNVARGSEQAEAFFRVKLGDVEEPAAPFGLVDVRADSRRLDQASVVLDPALASQILARANSAGVTAARLFHAAWALVVARTTGIGDVVYGTVLSTSRRAGALAQGILAVTVNTVPLRLRLDGLTASELIKHTHEELQQTRAHACAPLALAQRCSGVAATLPLFTTLLNYRHSKHEGDWANAAAGLRVLARGEAPSNYPITLSVDEREGGFVLTAQTDRSIAPERVLGYVRTALESLVEALADAPHTPAMSLTILPEGERQKLVEEFNATNVSYPTDVLVHQLFEQQVERTPQAVAVVFEDQSLTYAELNREANQLARYLRQKGVGADELVGLCLERSLEMVIGLLGILKAGAAYVPLNPRDPVDRLGRMLNDARPRVLLTQERLKNAMASLAAEVIPLDGDARSQIREYDASNLDAGESNLSPRSLAYVIYTSGSTGAPKGAMNEHRGVVNRLTWMQDAYGLTPEDRVLQKTPYTFDVSVWEFFWTLMTGARLVVARPQGHQDPEYLRQIIDDTGVTTLHFVPSMLQIFLDEHREGRCPSIRHVVCSGEELTVGLQRLCSERLPRARLSNLYGPTEAAVDVTAWECEAEEHGVRVPIGRPIANIQMYVLDRRLDLLPVGATGEIYIGGTGVGRGYLNRPELTAERFIRDPFNSDAFARLYKTGDLGRWRADGALEYLGRNDHQVKLRGFRIELGEIEAQFLRHPGVKEAVVIAREDRPGEKYLVAYVVPRVMSDSESAPSIQELRAHLKEILPEYLVPSAFVMVDSLPLTSSGKLDRRALPSPGSDAYARNQYEAPLGEIEETVAEIWKSLLRVERVSRRDSFLEIGGHSLLATRVISRIRELLKIELPVWVLFEAPTVEQLALRIEAEECRLATQEAVRMQSRAQTLRQEIDQMQDDAVLARLHEIERMSR